MKTKEIIKIEINERRKWKEKYVSEQNIQISKLWGQTNSHQETFTKFLVVLKVANILGPFQTSCYCRAELNWSN